RLAIFAAVIVLMAAVFRVVPDADRKRLRRSVVLFGLYVLVTLGARAAQLSGLIEVARGLGFASDLLTVLLVINLAALGIFDLLLRATRWDYPDILHDVVVGAA